MRKMMMLAVVLGVLSLQPAVAQMAQMYQTVPADQAQLLQEGPGRLYCPNCGMHLVKFYRTGHALENHQYCSLHCLVEANDDLSEAMVVDQTSLKFIPASEAFYVVGSAKPGTMTMKSKYAFADENQARAFAKEHGGEVVDFMAAVEIARGGLERENEKIDGKRAKMATKGEKIFQTFLVDVDFPHFSTIAEAKTYLGELKEASSLDDQQLQAVAIYLMRKNTVHQSQIGPPIEVPEKAKCPVCGMFVAKYPRWAARYQEWEDDPAYYFDGVKDFMKFYADPAAYGVQPPLKVTDGTRVTEYYTLGSISPFLAFYVVGSDVYGPMGKELIPFATHEDAETFMKDHGGDRILRFNDITHELLKQLDE
jgi:nitrous oxide reductase accessory protein NosL